MNPRFKKFLSYYKPYRKRLFADMLAALFLSAISLSIPLCARYITNTLLAPNSPNALSQIYLTGAGMLVLIAGYTLCNFFVDYHGHRMGAKMESDMRRDLFAHYQKLSFRFYDDEKTGQLMTRLTNDLFWLSELYHHGPEDLVIALLNFSGTIIILSTINLELSLIIFLFLPVMTIYAFYFNQRMNRALGISKERIGDINAQVEDSLAGIRVVKSFTNEGLEKKKFAYANQRFLESRSDGYRSEAYFDSGMIAFTYLITVAVIILGSIQIFQGTLNLGDLLTYLLFVGILIEPIRRLVNFARLYQEGITGFQRFMAIMELEPDIQDAPNARDIQTVQGKIDFKQVSFKYKEEYNHALKNISLTIKGGEYLALVGSSGVGKTTLCSLIPRFYEINEGEILLDGQNIRELRLESLRKQIGIVQQDVYLFAGTVADNIHYGNLDASFDDIVEAAKKAHAHDFIMALPDGYETDIGQRGVKLSGGQKQRLSIARVFLKNPPIIIFDEATSALDNESEKAIQTALERLRDNRTMIVIAHRLSTIRNAERILVLSDNGIDEEGCHEDLMALGGLYAKLYAIQTPFSQADAAGMPAFLKPLA